jgi:hypothetical protein
MVLIKKTDDAVSPIIALILMVVAIGIIALIIIIYTYGLAVDVRAPKIISASVVQPTTNQIVVTYTGGRDAAKFIGANISIKSGPPSTATGWTWTHGEANGSGLLDSTVGSLTIATSTPGTTWTGKDHVVVVGWFSDGMKQVIVDAYV